MKQTRLSQNEKLILISNIATMLSAGIPILETVDSMLSETKGKTKIVLETLKNDLNQGKTIAASFTKFPSTFDPVIVSLIKASEEAGTLDTTLKDLTFAVKKDIEFTSKIKAALVYPVLILGVFCAVLTVILTFVIPRISTVFSRLRIDLPLPTKILIYISNILVNYFPFVLTAIVMIVIAIFFLYNRNRKAILNLFFKLPLLSTLSAQIDFTRFTRSLSLLISSGIPINESLRLTKDVVNKKELSKVIEVAIKQVSSGEKLSHALKQNKQAVPSIMIRITEAGEKSGSLDKSMQELSEYFDIQVSNTLKTVSTLFEPVLLGIIGLLVGGVLLAIIAPIYNTIGQIKAR